MRPLPAFVNRGSRTTPVEQAAPVAQNGNGMAAPGNLLHVRPSGTPVPQYILNHYRYPQPSLRSMSRTPHPLQQSFYNPDFRALPPPGSGLRNESAGVGSGDPAGPRHAQLSMPPPPSPAPHQMDESQHGAHTRSATPQELPEATRVLSCLSCSRIVGDTESWVQIFEAPLDLLVLDAASDLLTIDPIDLGDGQSKLARDGTASAAAAPSDQSDVPNRNTLVKKKRNSPPPLHTSPMDAPDAGSSWHTLYCFCGYEIGRRYVSTTQPDLDALRGNFALSIQRLSYYEVGQYASGNSSRYFMAPGGPYIPIAPYQSNVTSPEEMEKIRTLLMTIGQRLQRLEEQTQVVPSGSSDATSRETGVPSDRPPSVSASSSAQQILASIAASSRIGTNRVRLIPNADDSFLPPRAIPRTTATPAPASGASIPDSATFSSSSGQNGIPAHTQARAAQPSAASSAQGSGKDSRAQTASRHDSSPYSSPPTPTPAPAVVTLSQTQKSNSTVTARTNAPARMSSPAKRKASESSSAEVIAQRSSQRDQKKQTSHNGAMDLDDSESKNQNGVAIAKRRRQNSSQQVQQGSSRDHEEEPATKATKTKGRKSEAIVPSQDSVQDPTSTQKKWPIGVLMDDDDEDELAIGADASILLEESSDGEEDRVAATLGSQPGSGRKAPTGRKKGSSANNGAGATSRAGPSTGSISDDRKQMPPPPVPSPVKTPRSRA